jgi:hypothetical protein
MNLTIFSIVGWCETYDASGKRDPFVPLVTGDREAVRGLYGVETLDDLTIEGIVFDAAHGSIAIVNGEIVREGETRANLKIVKIQSNGVLFEINEIEQFKSFGSDD